MKLDLNGAPKVLEVSHFRCPQNQSDLLLKYSKASAIPFNQPQPIATTVRDCKTFLMRQSPAYLKVLIHTRSQKRHEEREKWFVVN